MPRQEVKQEVDQAQVAKREVLFRAIQDSTAKLEAMQAAKQVFKEKLNSSTEMQAIRAQMKETTMAYKTAQAEMHKLAEELSDK